MNRLQLGMTYGRGFGIEMGAFHNPWPVSGSVFYVDKVSKEELLTKFPEYKSKMVVEPQMIVSAEDLEGIPDGKYDFLCSSHVFEHMENTLQALFNWLRVCKPGGYLLLAIPEKRNSFDRDRPITPWNHTLQEWICPGKVRENRRTHLIDYYINVDKNQVTEAEHRADITPPEMDIHFHVWDEPALKELFQTFQAWFTPIPFDIIEWEFVGHEVFVVLRRRY